MTDPSEQATDLINSDQSADSTSEDKSSQSKTKPQRGKGRTPQNKPRRQGKTSQRREGRYSRDSKGFKLTSDGLTRHFLGCRVCCYFFTGLQVQYGRDVVNRLVDEFDGKWFSVPFSKETQSLLHKTYSLRVDTSDEYLDFSCEVCCRRFEVEVPTVEASKSTESIDDESDDSSDRQEIEPEAIPQRRPIEEQVAEWDAGDLPLLRIEFKHKR